MTIVRLADRLARLEARRNPPEPDPRVAEEARERILHGVLGLLAAAEMGEEPTSLIGRALVEFDCDICAACSALLERRGRTSDDHQAQRATGAAERRREPVPDRGLAEAERRLIALANEVGVDADDPVALLALIETTLNQLRAARR